MLCAPHQRSDVKHALPGSSTTDGLLCRASTGPGSEEIELDECGCPLHSFATLSDVNPKVASSFEVDWKGFLPERSDSVVLSSVHLVTCNDCWHRSMQTFTLPSLQKRTRTIHAPLSRPAWSTLRTNTVRSRILNSRALAVPVLK